MSEFSIRVDQSLVTKTLDQIKPFPYPVLKYPSSNPSLIETEKSIEEKISVSYSEMKIYTTKAVKILENQGEKFFSKEISEKYDDNDEIQNIISLIEFNNKKETDKVFAKYNHKTDIEEKKDALVYATLLSANYIIENGRLYTSEEDLILLQQAKEISEEENIEDLLFLNSFNKGLGGFLKKLWKKGKKIFKKILNWTKRQLEKVIKIKFELSKLDIDMTDKPDFILGNPLRIRSLNLEVRMIRVDIKYRLFGKWRKISFSFGNKVELKTSAKFALSSENNKVYVLPKFDKLKFRIKILGVWFTIGLTKVVNLILSIKGKLLVYDLSGLISPMEVKGLEYIIKEVKIPKSQKFIRMDVSIDVKTAS
jgi:uncharacterized protein YifE (UPF0438 family)